MIAVLCPIMMTREMFESTRSLTRRMSDGQAAATTTMLYDVQRRNEIYWDKEEDE